MTKLMRSEWGYETTSHGRNPPVRFIYCRSYNFITFQIRKLNSKVPTQLSMLSDRFVCVIPSHARASTKGCKFPDSQSVLLRKSRLGTGVNPRDGVFCKKLNMHDELSWLW